jgi:putative DNA primase/helicase
MPMEMLAGDCTEVRAEMLSMGIEIDANGKQLLTGYLSWRQPKARMLCAAQVGWQKKAFVLPDTVVGPGAESIIFQSGERGHEEYGQGGTLEAWQNEIAKPAIGNPMLVLAICAAFVGPLLVPCLNESGGIHLFGDSSTGKSTSLEVGSSVWGGPNHKRSWRATANGLEGAAVMFNDTFLPLDEIGECQPKEVGAVVYMLANGHGKQRANRTGSARKIRRWRSFVLSTGETSIATAMHEGGARTKAGQSVRILDVPSQRKHGIFDDLHEFKTGQLFSDALKRGAAKNYGHAGRAFLERLTRDKRDMPVHLEAIKRADEFITSGGEGQDKRAAARFAIVAMAGELAIEYGIVPWPKRTALAAAKEAYQAWQSQRTRGNDEPRQVLNAVESFIDRHGDARFSDKTQVQVEFTEFTVRERAGWWEDTSQGRLYLFTSDGLREALKGFDFIRALDVLQAHGALLSPTKVGERRKSCRIGKRVTKLYVVAAERLGTA